MHRRIRSQDEQERKSPAIDRPRALSPAASILALQRSAGNAAVARMLAAQTGKGAPVGDDPHSIPEITGNGTDTPVDSPAIDQPRPLSRAASILALQRSAGNAAVARMLAAQTGKGAP